MAKDKKSFLLYCDLIHTVSKMPNDKAGELLKHILAYVNDLNPETEDLIIQLTFEPIKQQLKRDLSKYKEVSLERSEIGRLGGLKSGEARRTKMKQNEANASNLKQNEQDTDTDTDTVIVKDKINNIEARKQKFAHSLVPYVDKYGKEMIRKFHDYWTEPNKSNTKMAFELKRTWSLPHRLSAWADRNNQHNKNTIQQSSYKPKFTTLEDINKPLA